MYKSRIMIENQIIHLISFIFTYILKKQRLFYAQFIALNNYINSIKGNSVAARFLCWN